MPMAKLVFRVLYTDEVMEAVARCRDDNFAYQLLNEGAEYYLREHQPMPLTASHVHPTYLNSLELVDAHPVQLAD